MSLTKQEFITMYNTSATIANRICELNAKKQKVDPSLLQTLEEAYLQIIDYEKLFLVRCQDRFWGCLLMDMTIDIDFNQRGAIDTKIDEFPFRLTINPIYCAKYKFPEFTGLITNELQKIVFMHPEIYSKMNKEEDPVKHRILEDASSAASTSIVKNDIRLMANGDARQSNGCRLPDGLYTRTSIDSEFKVRTQEKMPLEYYYKILNKFKDKISDKMESENMQMMAAKSQMQGMSSQGSGNGNSQQTNQNGNQDQQDGKNGQGDPNPNIACPGDGKGNQTHQWEKGSKNGDIEDQIITMVANAYNSLSEREKGNIPGSVLSQIKALMTPPEINWKQILRRMIGSVPVPYRKTRTRLNRRQPTRADLSGRLPKQTVNVVVCFDTSGSMSDDDLKYCMNEVFDIVKVYQGYKITVVECDAEVGKVYEAKKIGDLQLKMSGRGK